MCDMTDSLVSPDRCKCVTWPIYVCDMTHSCVWHDVFMCVTWRIHVCRKTQSCVWHDVFTCEACLKHVCDLTHSRVLHDSMICLTRLTHVRDMTHTQRHDIPTFVTWLSHVTSCVTWRAWHGAYSGTRHSHMCHTRVMSQFHMCDMTHPFVDDRTHSHAWHDSFRSIL